MGTQLTTNTSAIDYRRFSVFGSSSVDVCFIELDVEEYARL